MKWIALIFMTIDHLAVLFEAIPMVAFCVPTLRLLGRIAAPLFLFAPTESIRHTRSKPALIFRLYIAGMFTGLFMVLTNLIFQEILVYFQGNIFSYIFMFFCPVFLRLGSNKRFVAIQYFFERGQYWMALALPITLLYSVRKGNPVAHFLCMLSVHGYLISFVAALIQM